MPLSLGRTVSLLFWPITIATIFFLGMFPTLIVGRFFSVCFPSPLLQLIPFLRNSLLEPENSCVFPRTLSLGILRACLFSLAISSLVLSSAGCWARRSLHGIHGAAPNDSRWAGRAQRHNRNPFVMWLFFFQILTNISNLYYGRRAKWRGVGFVVDRLFRFYFDFRRPLCSISSN